MNAARTPSVRAALFFVARSKSTMSIVEGQQWLRGWLISRFFEGWQLRSVPRCRNPRLKDFDLDVLSRYLDIYLEDFRNVMDDLCFSFFLFGMVY